MDPSDEEDIRAVISVKQKSLEQEKGGYSIIKWGRMQNKQTS